MFRFCSEFFNGAFIHNKQSLNFGDIFKDQNNSYYLCITALCDCLHPENIKNNIFFVKSSEKLKLEKAFELGDSGYISYLGNDLCIKWSSDAYVKPKQYHVPNPTIQDLQLELCEWNDNEPQRLMIEYVFTLKQNYAQRIANHAFTHPMRVGIDFLKTS